MNKNNGLSKKDRKFFSSQIAKKLTEMGIEDKIDFISSGRVKEYYQRGLNGLPELGEDGQPLVQRVEMPIARNTFRRTIKSLRNSDINVIMSFLNTPAASQPISSEQLTAQVEEEVRNEVPDVLEAEVISKTTVEEV